MRHREHPPRALSTCLIYLVILCTCLVQYCDCACAWPSVFQDGVWEDSRKEELTFTNESMTGYIAETFAADQTFTAWECYDDSYFTSDNILLLRSSTTVSILSVNWYGYLCWEMTQLSNVSYRYYTLAAKEKNVNYQRIRMDFRNITKDDICATTGGATGSEFNVLVKQGEGLSAKLQFPYALLGRFDYNYTTPDGTIYCDATSEEMNVCSDKTVATFDTPCAAKSLAYADGDVYCVASMVIGTDTYVQFYNPQTTVDRTTTYRFSCMVVSEDSSSATIVYDGCASDQTSTYNARDEDGNVIGATLSIRPKVFCRGACEWPADFKDSTWYDNAHGTPVFTTNSMTGWDVGTTVGTTISAWECLDDQYFDSEGILLIKSTQTFNDIGADWIVHVCLSMTRLTGASYHYKQNNPIQTKTNNNRVQISNTALTTRAQICTDNSVPDAEFQIMVKSGSAADAKANCADPLLAKMDYEHNDGTSVTCDTSEDNWDVCTDRQVMTFNYTTCATPMAFSTAGLVYCVYSMTSGGYTYQVVYNTDASPIYRFTCFVVESSGLAASMVSDQCRVGQVPTTVYNDGSSNIGAILTMTKFVTCPFGGQEPDGGISLGLIAGAVGGLIALIIAAIVGYCIYKKKCKKANGVEHTDPERGPEKTPPPADKPEVREKGPMLVEEADEPVNPALTITNLPRNTLTPLQAQRPVPGQNGVTPRMAPPLKGGGKI